jgi:hypothetical protein
MARPSVAKRSAKGCCGIWDHKHVARSRSSYGDKYRILRSLHPQIAPELAAYLARKNRCSSPRPGRSASRGTQGYACALNAQTDSISASAPVRVIARPTGALGGNESDVGVGIEQFSRRRRLQLELESPAAGTAPVSRDTHQRKSLRCAWTVPPS